MARLAPNCGALWGIYTLQGGDPTSSVTTLESRVGRRFDVTLRYHDFSHSFPGQFPDQHEQKLGQDRVLFMSWQAQVYASQTGLKWRDIAAGRYGAEFVVPAAQRIKTYGKPLFIAFDAEFDLRPDKGTPADYVAAYRHVHDVFREQGVTNVVWVWITTGYLGGGNADLIKAGYPGDRYADWVGYDPYNFYRCNGSAWETFEQTIADTYRWLMEQGFGDKPFFLSEYGTQYDPSDGARSTAWHRSIADTLTRYPNIKGLVRFDSQTCGVQINSGPGMLEAFADAGRHPHVNVDPGN
jgi:Glycosyl hydrolase family 26